MERFGTPPGMLKLGRLRLDRPPKAPPLRLGAPPCILKFGAVGKLMLRFGLRNDAGPEGPPKEKLGIPLKPVEKPVE